MKVLGTREENLQAIGKAYIDTKNGDARVLMIVLREGEDRAGGSEDRTYQGQIICAGLNDLEAAALCANVHDVLLDGQEGDYDD